MTSIGVQLQTSQPSVAFPHLGIMAVVQVIEAQSASISVFSQSPT